LDFNEIDPSAVSGGKTSMSRVTLVESYVSLVEAFNVSARASFDIALTAGGDARFDVPRRNAVNESRVYPLSTARVTKGPTTMKRM
jgi:hypothetical protein